MLLTDEQIQAWRKVAEAAGPHETWLFGKSQEVDPDEVARSFRETYDKNPPGPIHIVHVPQADGEGLYVAITGNGPTSQANAKHIAWCSPQNIRALLTDLEHTRDERDTAKRVLGERDAEIARLREEVARLKGDRCTVCDEEGIIYVPEHGGVDADEVPQACPMCDGTKSGYASTVTKERDAALAERDALAVRVALADEIIQAIIDEYGDQGGDLALSGAKVYRSKERGGNKYLVHVLDEWSGYITCLACSRAGGADRAVKHTPPACGEGDQGKETP